MDSRLTLGIDETFVELLKNAHQKGEKVHLLVDDHGIERAEGLIRHMNNDTISAFIELESGTKVLLRQIVAVNGIFRPEYGEC